jgi:membrane protein DedA with SNARE-associated domain
MIDVILSAHGARAYLFVFILLVSGAVGVPMPEDLSLIAGGILVHAKGAHPVIMLIVCYLGILVGDLIIYRIGWSIGPSVFRRRWFKRCMTSRRLQWARENLEQRTFLTILIARHLFYLRTGTFLVCGALRISFSHFLLCDAVAALITAPLMVGLGYVCAEHYETLLFWVQQTKLALIIGGIVLAGYFLLSWWRGRGAEEFTDSSDIQE